MHTPTQSLLGDRNVLLSFSAIAIQHVLPTSCCMTSITALLNKSPRMAMKGSPNGSFPIFEMESVIKRNSAIGHTPGDGQAVRK